MLLLLAARVIQANRSWIQRLDRFLHPDAYAYVARGAALLDQRGPNRWWERIVDPIDIRSCYTCVLGQVYRDEARVRNAHASNSISPFFYGVQKLSLSSFTDNGFAGLWATERAWRHEIAKRSA